MIDFKKFERLSKVQYGIIRELIVEEGLVENREIEKIIEQITKDRFELAKSKLEFARALNQNWTIRTPPVQIWGMKPCDL